MQAAQTVPVFDSPVTLPDPNAPGLTHPNVVGVRGNDDISIVDMVWDIHNSNEIRGIGFQVLRYDDIGTVEDPDCWQEVAFWRYVSFAELLHLPLEEREDADILGRQHALLSGVYNAGVELVYLVAGVYTPNPLGIVQVYGSAAEAWDLTSAQSLASEGGDLISSNLHSAFPYSRLGNLSLDLGRTVMAQLTSLPEVTCILGYPDPRKAKKGMGKAQDGGLGQSDDELASQQGEYMLRALGHLRRNFVFVVTAASVRREVLSTGMKNVARESSDHASRQRGGVSFGMNVGVPLVTGMNMGGGESLGASVGESQNVSDSWNQGWNEGANNGWSIGWNENESYGVNQGISENLGVSEGISYGASQGISTGISEGWSQGWSEGISLGESQGISEGISLGESQGWSEGVNTGTNFGLSGGHSENIGINVGESWGFGESTNWGQNTGFSETTNVGSSSQLGWSDGYSENGGYQVGHGSSGQWSVAPFDVGASTSTSRNYGSTHGHGSSFGISGGFGTSESYGQSATAGASIGGGESTNFGGSSGRSWGESVNTGWSQGGSAGHNYSENYGANQGWNQGVNQGWNQGWNQGVNAGANQGWNQGTNEGWNQGANQGRSMGVSRSAGENLSRSVGMNQGFSGGSSRGESWGVSATSGLSQNTGLNSGINRNLGHNMSTGLSPGINIGRNWNTEDDTAIRLTEMYRGIESVWNAATVEGGFLVTATLLTDRQSLRAGISAIQQAFHGPNVPVPVLGLHVNTQSEHEAVRMRTLVQAFLPSVELFGRKADYSGTGYLPLYSTILPAHMVAPYCAPNIFEDGRTLTVQQKPPTTAIYPQMPGEVVLGHFFSAEDGSLTEIPVQLERKRHFHTLVAGDTGFGKTVAMERLIYETTKEWKMRSVVFDFGAGWRKMMNAPGLEGRVNVLMLAGGASPLRWNPLQVSRRIDPEVHWRKFCEVFASVSGMGASRQMPEMRTILYGLYIRAGVLVDDPLVLEEGAFHKGGEGGLFGAEGTALEKDLPDYRNDHWWKVVDDMEADLCGHPVGTALLDMPLEHRQILGRHRSRQVDVADLLRGTRQRVDGIQDPHVKGYLQGITSRLETMVQGRASTLYRKADDVPDICDIVPADGGITVLEGGAQMDGVTKAFLLGWAGWQIYTDAVAARIERAVTTAADLQLVFEEANKIFTPGGGNSSHQDSVQGESTSEQWEAMWRDSRKYGVYLHAIAQNPSALPQGIVSSSNNTMVTQLKSQKDVDALMSHLHRSAKGYQDEEWRRYIASIPQAEAVCKFGYTFDRAQLEPFRMRPLFLDVPEPRDHEIVALRNRWEQQGLIVKPGNGNGHDNGNGARPKGLQPVR